MHLPDGFLAPGVAATTWLIAGGAIAAALRADRRDPDPMPAGVAGSVAAVVFAAQAVNIPVAAGISGHLIGSMLATVLLGPWRAMLAIATVLGAQALIVQDGGITAFGANFIDMGASGCLVGFAVAYPMARAVRGRRGIAAGAVVGAFFATIAGAALTAVWLAWSGLYPLSGILPVMIVTHVPIGLLEAAATGAIVVTLLRVRPDLASGMRTEIGAPRPLAVGTGMFGAALAVAILLTPFSSRRPDGLQAAAATLGFAHRARVLFHVPGLASAAPAVACAAGTAVTAALAWVLTRSLAGRDDDHR